MIPPYAFTGPYADCFKDARSPMDRRHVYLIHGLLARWNFSEALELGSFMGASSTAFIEAVNCGHLKRATFCDVDVTDSLLHVLANARDSDKVRLTREHSWDVLESDDAFDFILVDANHDTDSVTKELNRLVLRKPLCLVAHDTNATAAGRPRCEGAILLKRAFEALPGYQCLEDCKQRDGERTDRGLFLATTDPQLYDLAKQVFADWS